MEPNTSNLYRKLWGISLILALLLLAISTFFWQDGGYGVTAGTILVCSMVFMIPAIMRLFSMLATKTPYYAVWGLLLIIYKGVGRLGFLP